MRTDYREARVEARRPVGRFQQKCKRGRMVTWTKVKTAEKVKNGWTNSLL